MPTVARIGDPILCGDIIAEGSGDVFAEGMPVTRVQLDLTAGHCFTPTKILSGSSNVFVNDQPIARTNDPIEAGVGIHFCVFPPNFHNSNIASGATSVYANE